MIQNLEMNVTFTEFASYCFTSYNQFGNDIANALSVQFPGSFTPWNFGPNQPGSSQRSLPWFVTDLATGAPVNGGQVAWSPTYGRWVAEYPIPASSGVRWDWVLSLTDLETFDGGSAGTVSDTTGPFWEVDALWADKFGLGVGTVIPTVATNLDVFDDAAPGAPQARSFYKIKRTARRFRTFS